MLMYQLLSEKNKLRFVCVGKCSLVLSLVCLSEYQLQLNISNRVNADFHPHQHPHFTYLKSPHPHFTPGLLHLRNCQELTVVQFTGYESSTLDGSVAAKYWNRLDGSVAVVASAKAFRDCHRPTSRSRKPLRLADDILRLATPASRGLRLTPEIG